MQPPQQETVKYSVVTEEMQATTFRPTNNGTIPNIFAALNDHSAPESDLIISIQFGTSDTLTSTIRMVQFGYLVSGPVILNFKNKSGSESVSLRVGRKWLSTDASPTPAKPPSPPSVILTNPTPAKSVNNRELQSRPASTRQVDSSGSSSLESVSIIRLSSPDERGSSVSTPPTEVIDSETGKYINLAHDLIADTIIVETAKLLLHSSASNAARNNATIAEPLRNNPIRRPLALSASGLRLSTATASTVSSSQTKFTQDELLPDGLRFEGTDEALERALKSIALGPNPVKKFPVPVTRLTPLTIQKDKVPKIRLHRTLGLQPYAQQDDYMESNIEEPYTTQREWDRLGNAKRLVGVVYNNR